MIKLIHQKGSCYQLQIDNFVTDLMGSEDKGIIEMDCIELPKSILKKTIDQLPNNSLLTFYLGDDFFHYWEIKKKKGKVSFFFRSYNDRSNWPMDWAERIYIPKITQNLSFDPFFKVISKKYNIDHSTICVQYITSEKSLRKVYQNGRKLLTNIVEKTKIELNGFVWRDVYSKDEYLFSVEFIKPLLLKLGFSQVKYNHGRKEYGKDFIFIDHDKFGQKKSYALQVKAGDIRGNVKSKIDEILGQIEDAFSMPFFDIGSKTPQYISCFIVATSGFFTENAKEKIAEKLRKSLCGSVYFLDKDSLLELIYKVSNNRG